MSDNHKNTLKTAWNDVTGDTINNSLKSDQKKFDSGWDAIWGKKRDDNPPEDKNDIAECQMSLINKMIEEMESTPEGKAEMDALREGMRGGCPSLD